MSEAKTALVTGASGGIGKAIAIAMAEAGYDILLNYGGNTAGAEEVKATIEEKGRQCHLLQADVSDFEAVKAMFDEGYKTLGHIDVLVNNAGITRDNLILRMSEADYDAVLDVNLKGTFNCCKHVARKMLKQRAGRIINITSIIGEMGNAGQANYGASKAGVIGLTKSLAREFASRHVTVNAIAPGFIETTMTDRIPEKERETMIEAIPLGALGQPEDVANTVVFLASEQASYITGQVIAVNGGLHM